MGVVECNTNGEKPSRKLVEANAAVFDNGTLDLDAWHERMQAGRSWALTNDAGFLAAHERIEDDGTCVINIWIMGVRKEARGSGAFRELVGALLAEIARTRGLWQFANTQLTMTTRPEKFAKMFAILCAAGARRCDTPEDEHAGKARFRVPVLVVALALWRRQAAAACTFGALAAVALALVLGRARRQASLE